jgi:tetratricopeptide (TPR) repeat protein
LSIQPIFPYFLQARLQQANEVIRDALRIGFQNHYRNLASSYKSWMSSKDSEEKQLGIFFCRLEYENLYAALQSCLEKQEEFSILFCLTDFFELTQDNSSLLTLMTITCQQLEAFSPDYLKKECGYQISFAFHRLANAHLAAKRFAEAKNFYRKAFDCYEQLTLTDRQQRLLWQSSAYHQLGRVAQELREWDDARHNYHQALAIFVEFGDRYSQAGTYHNLGIVAQELREWDDARHNYHQVLAIFVEFGDRYSQAGTYHNLGIVAQELREWDEARDNYHQALAIFVEFGDRYEQADTYHQLGIVAQKLREWDDARHNYHQALSIFVEFGDRYSQASTYYQLGRVAEEVGDSQEAINNYLQDLAITAKSNDQHGLGISMRNLARFYKSTPNPELLKSIANILEVSEADVQQQFQI